MVRGSYDPVDFEPTGGTFSERVIGDRYRLQRRLGQGSMGEVWLAEHAVLRLPVAVKVLAPDFVCEPSLVRRTNEMFRMEAQLSAQLGALTPHIVRVYDAGIDDIGPFLVMEYVRGQSLEGHLQGTPLAVCDVDAIVDQIGAALAIVHEHGVVHRDVKPGNIMLSRRGDGAIQAKLADFGVADVTGPGVNVDSVTMDGRGAVVGTPGYMSPEQLLDIGADHRSDLWAFAVVVYEALTGLSPFGHDRPMAQMRDTLVGKRTRATALRPDLPLELDAWFERALARRADDRFQSARVMARAFRASLSPAAITSPGFQRCRMLA